MSQQKLLGYPPVIYEWFLWCTLVIILLVINISLWLCGVAVVSSVESTHGLEYQEGLNAGDTVS